MTLVLHDMPEDVARALRAKAQAERKTLEQVAIELLRAVVALGARKRDLSDLAGTWKEDPEFDRIMREQDRIDPVTETPEHTRDAPTPTPSSPSATNKSDFSGVVGTWVEDPIFDQIRRDHEQR